MSSFESISSDIHTILFSIYLYIFKFRYYLLLNIYFKNNWLFGIFNEFLSNSVLLLILNINTFFLEYLYSIFNSFWTFGIKKCIIRIQTIFSYIIFLLWIHFIVFCINLYLMLKIAEHCWRLNGYIDINKFQIRLQMFGKKHTLLHTQIFIRYKSNKFKLLNTFFALV